MGKHYTLVGVDGKSYESAEKGTYGGHRPKKIYGKLDCPVALRAIANGGYVKNRVFFRDAETAIASWFCPCCVCMRDEYKRWMAAATIAA